MDKKAKKSYDKAMECYEKGNINKALDICEEILIEGLDNPVILNFKGLLLYQKGNLSEAITVWKINKELNNDNIAGNYIKDAMHDEIRLDLYRQGEQALKQLKIDRALELFMQCAESDFNTIKVNTGIALCYQKKGDLYKAKEYVDKALSIDKNAVTAKIVEKELKEDGIYLETRNSSKGILIGVTIIVLILAFAAGGYAIFSKNSEKNLSEIVSETTDNGVIEEKSSTKEDDKEILAKEEGIENSESIPKEIVEEETPKIYFDKEKLKLLMSNNDLDGLYELLNNLKAESLSNEDTELYNQAIGLMKSQGVSKFYEYGLWYFNQGNYSDAKISLDKAYTYCEGNILKEHIIFYRASSSLKKTDNQTALVQYEEYFNKYPNGVYIEEVLYELALLSNSVNKEKSKIYANTLINNFPGSIYINDNITSVLNS